MFLHGTQPVDSSIHIARTTLLRDAVVMNISNHDVLTLTGIPLETQQLLRVVRSLAVVNLYGRSKFDPNSAKYTWWVCELIARNNNKVSSL